MPSTAIARIKYDAPARVLTVVFVSGMVYKYLNVPQSVYDNFKTSGSKGTYLNKFIKGFYDFEKQTEE